MAHCDSPNQEVVVANFETKRYYFNAFASKEKVVYKGKEKQRNSCEEVWGEDAYNVFMAYYITTELAMGLYTIGEGIGKMAQGIGEMNIIEDGTERIKQVGEVAKETW